MELLVDMGDMPNRPNVLFLVDDQHRHDVLGYAGDNVVRTPTLDSLAETGTTFTNAYTPSPICVPARQSIRTGQLPRTWDRFGLDAFESGYRTMARQFAEYGYMTASAGKMHYPGLAQMQGWRKRIGPTPMKRTVENAPYDVQEDPEYGDRDYGGFSDWKWSQSKEIKRAGVGKSRVQVQDRRSVEGTEQFLKQYFAAPYYDRSQPGRPLFLQTSLIQPHYPFFSEFEDRFTFYLERVDPYVQQPHDFHPNLDCGRQAVPGEDVSEREIRRATAAYYAMVETVDDLFGDILDTLRHLGEDLDEWVIVFTSDHGEMLGERSLWEKVRFWEASANVPLIIRYPERFDPGTVTENVTLCDLYATLCDLCDLPVPPELDSRSLVPLLDGDTGVWHERYDNEAISQGARNGSVAGGVDTEELMIKRDGLKYCYYGEDVPEVLFDIERDPDETTNYADDPEYADAVAQFRERRSKLGYGPDGDPDYATAGYDPGVEIDER
jgi:choline-sulfatase